MLLILKSGTRTAEALLLPVSRPGFGVLIGQGGEREGRASDLRNTGSDVTVTREPRLGFRYAKTWF